MCTSPGVMTPTELQEALADGVSHNKFATTIHQGWADRLKMHIDDVKCIAWQLRFYAWYGSLYV